MATYRQDTRPVEAHIQTPFGWLTGVFHPPRSVALMDFLNNARDFFSLTDVLLPMEHARLPFFALQRTSTALIIPAASETNLRSVAGAMRIAGRQVACLMDNCLLEGKVEILENTRLSDYFKKVSGFLFMQEVNLSVQDTASGELHVNHYPAMIVNTDAIIGISEAENMPLAAPAA